MRAPRGLSRFGGIGLRATLAAQTSRRYWQVRRILEQLRSKAGVTAATARVRARRARGAGRAVRVLVRRAIPTALTSASIVALALLIESAPWTPSPPSVPAGGSLYGTLAGFAGVFLGFYYTALGVVIEQVYAKGSRTLRRLVLAGRMEEVYVWFVVFLGVTSLLFLAVETAGHATGVVSIGAVTAAGVVALVGASRLMTGGLRYFDPAVLALEARAEFERLYALVRDTPSGQVATTAARVSAAPQLDVLVELAEGGDERVGHHALLLLQRYWTSKPERSSDSAWWGDAVRRPDWFLADSTSVEMAVQQGGHITAESVPDWEWVERPAVECVGVVLGRLLNAGKWSEAHGLLELAADTIRVGALSLLVQEADALLREVTDVLLRRWDSNPVEVGRVGGARPADLWDAHGRCVVQLVIGARLGWESFVDRLPAELDGVPATSPRDAERLRFPVRSKARLQDLARRLEFEAAVEGGTPTRRWFWADYVAPKLLWELCDHFETVEDAVDRQQGDVRPGLVQDPLAAATAARRTTEVRHLWSLFRDVAREAEGELRDMVRSEDYDLPEVPVGRSDGFDVRERLEDARWIRDGVWPLLRYGGDPMAEELIGHGYARLMDRCVSALAERDAKTFRTLFRSVLGLSVYLDTRVPFRGREMIASIRGALSVQPGLDLMAVSGLALVRDEVSGPGYWEPVRAAWDEYLDGMPDKAYKVRRYLLLADPASLRIGLTARGVERSRWRIALSQALRQEGVPMDFRYAGSGPPPARHVLRAALDGSDGVSDPVETFAVFYLAARPEAAGVDLGYRLSSALRQAYR